MLVAFILNAQNMIALVPPYGNWSPPYTVRVIQLPSLDKTRPAL